MSDSTRTFTDLTSSFIMEAYRFTWVSSHWPMPPVR